jgi:hypothetical protein
MSMGVAKATPNFIRGSDPVGLLPSFFDGEARDEQVRRFH